MNNQELFQKNVERWQMFCPEIAPLLRPFATLTSNQVRGPSEEEAAKWIEQLDYASFDLLYVYGLGSFAPYAALKGWLSQKNHFLIILEPNLEALADFFKSDQAEEALNNEKIWIYYLDPQHRVLNEIAMLFPAVPFSVTSIFSDQNTVPLVEELKAQISFFHNLYSSHTGEHRQYGVGYFSNYFPNLLFLPNAYLGNSLFNKFQGLPAIICGAGPSLAKNIELLKGLKEKALIFGGGTGMNALNAAEMTPHFGVGIDPNPEQVTRTIMNSGFEVPFLYRNRMNHYALNLIHADKLFISGSSGYSISEYFEKECGIEGQEIDEGFNVVTLSVSLASAMGCNPIIFVGVDLAYSDDKSYAPGMSNHPIHKQFSTKAHTDVLTYKKDIYGNPVPTLWKWITESLWFSNFAEQHPELRFINATEGGIGFDGIPNLPLATVVEECLQEELGIGARLFGEIQKGKIGDSVTQEKLLTLFQALQESLSFCGKAIQDHLLELIELQKNKEKLLGLKQSEVKELLRKMLVDRFEDAIGHRYILRDFYQAFDLQEKREFVRIEIDAKLLSAEEWLDRLLVLEIKRALFLQQTALVNDGLLQKVIVDEQLKAKNRVEKPQVNTELVVTDEGRSNYRYENNQLILNDPDIGLNVSEEFIPDPVAGVIQLYEPEGILKFESYRKAGKLHGPTRFYRQDKGILTESWYLNGLQEGKAFIYYLSGALYAVQQYKAGKQDGKQVYFFEDQKVRTVANYSNGLLEGDLFLFHRNGIKARQLHFSKGKRDGTESFWNEAGFLVIQSSFKEGRPVGEAKVWHPNGQLVEVTHYNESSEIMGRSRWDSSGNTITDERLNQVDYFQHVAKGTKDLTLSIKGLFREVASLTPMLARLYPSDLENKDPEKADINKDVKVLAENLSQIGEAIANLEGIHEQLMFESGMDAGNQGEAFWKTAALQREIELKLGVITGQMQKDVSEIRSSLLIAVEAIAKKQPQDSDQEMKDPTIQR
ncbi:MAG: motility associated factor glycosyltransferase family protein [Parachlamydiaceae bacterium]|nr:motility associated factor glycosyltransferase family protein [Parachlamydiaceae bacterium]